MMQMALLTIFFICFTFIAWQKFDLALFFLFLLLPTYLIRFDLFLIPTNVLEMMVGTIVLFWLFKKGFKLKKELIEAYYKHKNLFIGYGIFIFGATISIFTSTDLISAAGTWKTFYVEPFLVFLVLITTIKNKKQINKILFALVLSGLITSLLAIYQKISGGWMVPTAFWENNNSFRVTGWYGFPNAVGLFLAPIVPIAVYLVNNSLQELIKTKKSNTKQWLKKMVNLWKDNRKNRYKIIILVISLITIPSAILGAALAKSTAALIGITGAIGVLFLFYRRIRWIAITVGAVALLGLFSLPEGNKVKKELLLQNQSAQLRIDMWQETTKFLRDNPVMGAGIGAYKDRIYPYRQNKLIEVFHHPHNLFLTIWVNLGATGLIGFLWILVWFFREGVFKTDYSNIKYDKYLSMFAVSIMATFLIIGLVDSPYIKNDLAIFFWLPFVLMFIKNKIPA